MKRNDNVCITMRIGWMQTEPVYGDPRANLRAVREGLAGRDADLWVLPELFSTGYLFGSREEVERLAEPIPYGPTVGGLVELASESSCAIVAGIAERGNDGRFYNSAILVDGGGVRARYRKIHLFDLETSWFDRGREPNPVVSVAGSRIGLMICFDWRFPEVSRTLALRGAQVIAHPSNLVQPYCQAAMVTRALENRIYTVTVNRVGTEARDPSRLTFTGRSRIVAPDGAILCEGKEAEADSGIVEIDTEIADDKWVTPRNHLFEDRQPACYEIDPVDPLPD